MNKKASLYLHIPFCVRKCHYCDFLSIATSKEKRKTYLQSLAAQIRQTDFEQYEPYTIFFGGGTPSLLEPEELLYLKRELERKKMWQGAEEITIECNPDSITKEKLKTYRNIGINRLSIGLQSTHTEELKLLGRIHDYENFLEKYKMARQEGFDNINIDLMSAIPKQTVTSYINGLNKIMDLNPEHISSYSLIIEENTRFYENQEIIKLLPNEEDEREMYHRTKELLEQNGYERYEISNYAKPGKECRHNLVYWELGEYFGLGLGASSYVKEMRYKNHDSFEKYEKQPNQKIEIEKVGKQQKMEEFIFLGLRKIKGISKETFHRLFEISIEEVYGEVIKKYEASDFLESSEEWVRFTSKGLDVSNQILSEFLLTV
ncbi:MAG: oxygen-independent coproporphyrinogen III oxidase [Lachnospiraceae bacterium]|nr:oxygen-independent coproporphyrinogen III oxidase [Lachnospiraceae bacterium]